ncbi:hypothetical protein LXL04_027646 [Taraxacum kok-saghyz]
MSDSVRGPRRLIGEFDVGLGPWSVVRGLSPSPSPLNSKQPLRTSCDIHTGFVLIRGLKVSSQST